MRFPDHHYLLSIAFHQTLILGKEIHMTISSQNRQKQTKFASAAKTHWNLLKRLFNNQMWHQTTQT
jgi:hypothetical protein